MAMDFSGNDFIGLGYGDSRTAVNDESSNLSSSPLNRPQHYSGANFVRPQYPSHESNNREKVSAPNLSRWGPAKSTPTPKPPVLPQPQIDTTLDLTQRTQIARERALSVIQKFRENSELNLLSFDPTELSRKRRVCLDMLKERQQIALVKNFEYIARQEDQRLKQQLLNMQQAKDYQSQVEDYHSKQLERRYQHFANGKNYSMISHSQAGVGTEQRQRVENKRKHQTMTQDSASLYVSNLPTDGSVTEELMRALFGSYGRLRKIHFYIDKDTGHLKGDALVIFNTDDVDDKSKLLDAVCSQMNGAELSCGTAIKVERSDPLYQIRKKKQMNYYGRASEEESIEKEQTQTKPASVEASKSTDAPNDMDNAGDDNDDLDDFFASLS